MSRNLFPFRVIDKVRNEEDANSSDSSWTASCKRSHAKFVADVDEYQKTCDQKMDKQAEQQFEQEFAEISDRKMTADELDKAKVQDSSQDSLYDVTTDNEDTKNRKGEDVVLPETCHDFFRDMSQVICHAKITPEKRERNRERKCLKEVALEQEKKEKKRNERKKESPNKKRRELTYTQIKEDDNESDMKGEEEKDTDTTPYYTQTSDGSWYV